MAVRTLLFGIGNAGRGDDGLGWAFLDRLRQERSFPGSFEYRYQLQVEDAALASHAGRIVFVDAFARDLPGGFRWRPCMPSPACEFTTHALPPQAVLQLCRELYGRTPRADLLEIQGHCWELGSGLSPDAERTLERALRFFLTEMSPDARHRGAPCARSVSPIGRKAASY